MGALDVGLDKINLDDDNNFDKDDPEYSCEAFGLA